MADEKATDPTNDAKAYAESARQSADDAQKALSAVQDLLAKAAKESKPAPTVATKEDKALAEAAKSTSGAVPEYPKRREVTKVSSRPCVCGAPLYAHNEEKPFGCPESECGSFALRV